MIPLSTSTFNTTHFALSTPLILSLSHPLPILSPLPLTPILLTARLVLTGCLVKEVGLNEADTQATIRGKGKRKRPPLPQPTARSTLSNFLFNLLLTLYPPSNLIRLRHLSRDDGQKGLETLIL